MGLFGDLERLAKNVATEIGKNVKMCPSCGAPASADQKFCPSCGTQLPEETAAAGAVCPSCGTQNTLGTNFCQQCGTKLPIAIQQEQAAQARDAAVMQEWDQLLGGFPKWNCGGTDFSATGGHLGGEIAPHPRHSGDLPPLLSRGGRAYMAVMTDRFSVSDIVGRTVVIHSSTDDFKTQPAGDPGKKIACGSIQRTARRKM